MKPITFVCTQATALSMLAIIPQVAIADMDFDYNPTPLVPLLKPRQELPKEPEDIENFSRFEKVKTLAKACSLLKNHLISFYDSYTFVGKDCHQHAVTDPDELSFLIRSKRYPLSSVPAHIFRLIPFGKPYQESSAPKLTSQECRNWESAYLTTDGTLFFYIEKCKKRMFKDYFEVILHNSQQKRIQAVELDVLDRFRTGKDMPSLQDSETKWLYAMDDDIEWSRSRRASRSDPLETDTPKVFEKIAKLSPKVDKKALCQRARNKVVSFYSQFFFVDTECNKRPLEEGSYIEILQKAGTQAGVIDLSAEEEAVLKLGKTISIEEVWKKL